MTFEEVSAWIANARTEMEKQARLEEVRKQRAEVANEEFRKVYNETVAASTAGLEMLTAAMLAPLSKGS